MLFGLSKDGIFQDDDGNIRPREVSQSPAPVNNAGKLVYNGDAFSNFSKVIEKGRERQDRVFKPLLTKLLDRYENNTGFGDAFDVGQDLVEQNTEIERNTLNMQDGRTNNILTRAEFDQRQKDLDYQKGLSSAQIATDTRGALIDRQNQILSGGAAAIAGGQQ